MARSVCRWESVTEDELREIELDENACRLDLDSYESSKERLPEIEAVVAEAEEEFWPDNPPKKGRPQGGDRGMSRRTGPTKPEVGRVP